MRALRSRDRWSQEWEDILDIVAPYPGKPAIDVTAEMVKQGYTPLRMFHLADDFFQSLGLPAMNAAFYNSECLPIVAANRLCR